MGGRYKNYKIALLIFCAIGAVFLLSLLVHTGSFGVLNPKGLIASKERRLIITAVLLMSLIAVPVYFMVFFLAWKYRAGNNAEYDPNVKRSRKRELMWWAIPIAVVSALGILNWKSTHELDPYKPIQSEKSPLTIQVVALRWKWLFIYPEQNIATVNFIQFPEGTPLNFELTADAPMNSFWIPQLGSQMYAMAGMETRLHLIADQTGEFIGSAAEINGAGFAGMKFTAKATSETDFEQWVKSVRQSANRLDSENNLTADEYSKLAEPSESNPVVYYPDVDKNLYPSIIMKYMAPTQPYSGPMTGMEDMQ